MYRKLENGFRLIKYTHTFLQTLIKIYVYIHQNIKHFILRSNIATCELVSFAINQKNDKIQAAGKK